MIFSETHNRTPRNNLSVPRADLQSNFLLLLCIVWGRDYVFYAVGDPTSEISPSLPLRTGSEVKSLQWCHRQKLFFLLVVHCFIVVHACLCDNCTFIPVEITKTGSRSLPIRVKEREIKGVGCSFTISFFSERRTNTCCWIFILWDYNGRLVTKQYQLQKK